MVRGAACVESAGMIVREAGERDWPDIYRVDGTAPRSQTVVAVEDERILGSAKMGPNRPGRGAHVATGRFIVAPEYLG